MSARTFDSAGFALLKGQIDECRGRYVFGWAIPERRGAHCTVSVVDSMGETIAEAVADERREDLSSVGGGRCDFAFKIGVPLTDAPGPVRVFADGKELPGSPVLLEDDILDGALLTEGGRVSGWVSSRSAVSIAESVALSDQDGRLVLSLPSRLDPADSDPLFRPARFGADLPAACFGRAELCLTGRVGERGFARAVGPARLEGFLDALSETVCGGWLFSPDVPGRAFGLVVYRDGVQVAAGATRLHRGDVAGRHPGVGPCGFEIRLPPPAAHRPDGLTHVSLRLAGSERELFGGPFLVGERAAAVDAAYDAVMSAGPVVQGGSAVLHAAMGAWLQAMRAGEGPVRLKARALGPRAAGARRLAIVVPVHSDPGATRACLGSVLRHRLAGRDSVVIVDDNPASVAMGELVDGLAGEPDVFVLRNAANEGFVAAVNRALAFVRDGDVLLLNSDTEVYPGALDEMHRVLRAGGDIGSVTALSNKATLFSYPHATMSVDGLDDIGWDELAAAALRDNRGASVDIPTGHGFCLLLRREMIDEIGLLDTAFGRGYGEENEYCIRAAERGWRHVAAGGAFVRHEEARSFGAAKPAMVAKGLGMLADRFPEYGDRVRAFARADPVRRLRWPLDMERLRRFLASGRRLQLVIGNWLDGGTRRAAGDIEALVGEAGLFALRLEATAEGAVTLRADGLAMLAVFADTEADALFERLATLRLERVVVHQLLGFTEDFARRLRGFLDGRTSVFHVHDFYYACPRVTMIDASGTFCGGAAADRCARCVALDGAHMAHRMGGLAPADHRALFGDLLAAATHVVAPSADTAARLGGLLPGARPVALAHPQAGVVFPIGVRRGALTEICLLGALGPHKGSRLLLALARYARLNHPEYRFHLVGFSDIDAELLEAGNVSISGKYGAGELAGLVEATGARIALFLHGWPETFSYTLTEAVSLGLIPVVPDIGAPAERVREAGFGAVYSFPADAASVMGALLGVGNGAVGFSRDGALPLAFDRSGDRDRLRALYRGGEAVEVPAVAAKTVRRRAARK